jgi:hypothetical protein
LEEPLIFLCYSLIGSIPPLPLGYVCRPCICIYQLPYTERRKTKKREGGAIPATIHREKKDKEKGRRCYTSYHTQREERQRKGKAVAKITIGGVGEGVGGFDPK